MFSFLDMGVKLLHLWNNKKTLKNVMSVLDDLLFSWLCAL